MNVFTPYPPLLSTVKKTFGFLVLIFLAFTGSVNSQTAGNSWKNPLLIAGSDFGRVFQGYYKTGNHNMLLTMTSQESRTKYGDSIILDYYSKMQFAYFMKLKAHKKVDDCYFLTYTLRFSLHLTLLL